MTVFFSVSFFFRVPPCHSLSVFLSDRTPVAPLNVENDRGRISRLGGDEDDSAAAILRARERARVCVCAEAVVIDFPAVSSSRRSAGRSSLVPSDPWATYPVRRVYRRTENKKNFKKERKKHTTYRSPSNRGAPVASLIVSAANVYPPRPPHDVADRRRVRAAPAAQVVAGAAAAAAAGRPVRAAGALRRRRHRRVRR